MKEQQKEYLKCMVKKRLRNILVLQPFNLEKRELQKAYDKMVRFKPALIYGLAGSVSRFAEFVLENDLPKIEGVKAVTSTAETLFEWQRDTIEKAFSCPVINEYGCSEVGSCAFECEHKGLHISDEIVFMEFLNQDGHPCRPGEQGELVATHFFNRYMPLIRYRMGDFGTPLAQQCRCGRSLSLMDLRVGKLTELIRLEKGKVLSSEIFVYIGRALLTKGLHCIKQFRIIQKNPELFVIEIAKKEPYNDQATLVFAELMREKFGIHTAVEFRFVERISPDPSGKIRYFINEMKD